MKENGSKNTSLTDWERVDALTDDEIDTSDIPPLDDDFFANAELVMPEPKQVITIRVDKDVLDWFKSQGKGYQSRMNAVLRMYMERQST
jgi:uncharacterized protein (DUF4415 family)